MGAGTQSATLHRDLRLLVQLNQKIEMKRKRALSGRGGERYQQSKPKKSMRKKVEKQELRKQEYEQRQEHGRLTLRS